MNIEGIGTDITTRNRFSKDNIDFNKKYLLEDELNLLDSYSGEEAINFLAGRWAAKEAIVKASNKKIIYSTISILKEDTGKPIVFVAGEYREDIHISISHEKSFTIAFCIIEKV